MQGIGRIASRETIRIWRKEIYFAKLEMGVALPFSGVKIKYETAKSFSDIESKHKNAA